MVDQADDYSGEREPFRLSTRARGPGALRTRRPAVRARRWALGLFTFFLTLGTIGAAGVAYLVLVPHDPIPVAMQSEVEAALTARVKHGLKVAVGGTDIDLVEGRPVLVIRELLVEDEAGRQIIKSPRAVLAIDPLSLVTGSVLPTRLDLRDLTVRLTILGDGALAFSAGTDETLPFRVADAFEPGAPGPVQPGAGSSAPAAAPASGDALGEIAKPIAGLIDRLTGVDDAFGGFDRLGIKGGTFILDDRRRNAVETFRNIAFDFEKVADGATRLSLAADGTTGRSAVTVRGARHPDGRRTLAVDIENLTLEQFRTAALVGGLGFDTDLPLSGSVSLGLGPSGDLAVARGQMRTGAGYFRVNDPDQEPILIDSAAASFEFDPALKRIVIAPAIVQVETSHYDVRGEVTPPTGSLDDPWAVKMSGSGTFGAERPGEQPLDLQAIDLDARYEPGSGAIHIENFALNGPQVSLGMAADIRHDPGAPLVQARLKAGRMPAPAILRLWPSLISAQVRSWLQQNVQGGMIEHGSATASLDDDDFAKMRQQRSVADGHIQLDYVVSDLTLAFMHGVPPLRDIFGTGTVTGDTSNFKVSRAVLDVSPDHQLTLTDGGILVPSTDPKPTPATITAHVGGTVETLVALLSSDALKKYTNLPSDLSAAKGQVDGSLQLGLKLGESVRNDEVKVGATAHLTNLTVDRLVGKQNLSNGDITITLDKAGLRAKGNATLFGAATAIDATKPAGTDGGEANVVMTLDDAARAKAGLNLGRSVTGPITAKIASPFGSSDKKSNIELDLTKTTLNEPVPGLNKAAGKPGKVTLVAIPRDGGYDLDNIACDIGTVSLRGSADLDESGGFQSAHLTQAKLSPGDDMRVDVGVAGDTLKLTVKGVNIDARPFLKNLTGSDAPDKSSRDLDLDLHTNVLTGQNSQVLTGVDVHLTRRGGAIRKLQVSAKAGRAPLSIASTQQGAVTNLMLKSGDAGATLAFLDLYKRLNGGQLDATIRMMDNRMQGSAVIREFGLREDPALERLTQEDAIQSKSGNDPHIDGSNLSFTKLALSFDKNGSRIDVKDGALFGPQMGATVQGTVDLVKDRVALGGTFVPLYGVNNLFAQLPVVGVLLGGASNEGLFGLNYKIAGSTANPNLTVDPLSVLAPGFLRKVFGALTDAADQGGAADATAKVQDPAGR